MSISLSLKMHTCNNTNSEYWVNQNDGINIVWKLRDECRHAGEVVGERAACSYSIVENQLASMFCRYRDARRINSNI